jgi:predicted small integral membrane protein
MDSAVLLAQFVVTTGLAGWLSTGVIDNLLHPKMNETYTAEVMSMARMRTEYPDAYAEVAHRAVKSRKVQLLAFRCVVAAELLATVVLWAGSLSLLAALFGGFEPEAARAIALWGAAAFVAVWSGFLVVGNYFSYWFCHEGAQNTHYQMTLWGIGAAILLSQG